LFILAIVCSTVIFCHSVIRLCMHAISGINRRETANRAPKVVEPEGFHPEQPIRVHLACDEELGLGTPCCQGVNQTDFAGAKGVTAPPPAYGLWRNSVVSCAPSVALIQRLFNADWSLACQSEFTALAAQHTCRTNVRTSSRLQRSAGFSSTILCRR
jgi:hypothetical protein